MRRGRETQSQDVPMDMLVKDDRVDRRIYTDPTIFGLEMERVFGKTWVYVGHESEVAAPGDYKRGRLGLEPIILTRIADGTLRVLVNRCAHRGALVCREESGNSKYFRCPYHGWTYRNSGELAGVPDRSRYPEDMDLESLGLCSVPRVATYRGLIFASFEPEVSNIVDYLGRARDHVDAILDFAIDGDIDLSPGPSKHRYPGNWKIQMENGVDGYHTAFVHETFFEIMGRAQRPELKFGAHGKDEGWTESFPNGHALLARNAHADAIQSLHEDYPEYTKRLIERHGEPRVAKIMTHMNLFIFPNLYLISHHLRVIQPLRVDLTDVTMYPYLLKGAPDDLNTRRLREHEGFYPTAGFGSPDDFEIFSTVQEGLQASSNPWVLFARGLNAERETERGTLVGGPTDEGHQRGIFRHYKHLMGQCGN